MNTELVEKLENLKVTLKEEGYKDWCYAMLTIDEAIKVVKTCNKPAVINNEAVICKDCGKYKKTQGNGIMHQLCECASEVAVCPKCHDRGWIYDDTTNTRTVCPCHY